MKAVVVGGGLGGISAAISLALDGFDVCLYEKNQHVGGKLNLLKKDGFSFDLGPSILTLPQIFDVLFTRAGKKLGDYVDIFKLSPDWRCFFEDGTVLDLYPDARRTVEANDAVSKEDLKGLQDFAGYSKKIYETVKKGYFDKGIDDMRGIMKEHGLVESWRGFDFFHTVHEGVSRRIKNHYLAEVYDYFVKYVGSSAYHAPALLNLMSHVQFEYGLWYVRGGMFNLALALERLLADVGVKVHKGVEVMKLNTAGNRVVSAELSNRQVVEADIFVSDMEVIPAYETLFEEQPSYLDEYKKRFTPACSGLVLHLGVDRRYNNLAHHNFFFSSDSRKNFREIFADKVLPTDPTIYLVASSRTDPSQAPKGCENVKVLPHIPHLQDEDFSESEYRGLKERVLDKLERMGLKDLRKHTVTEDMWLPADIKEKYYSNRGAIYGVVSDKKTNRGFKAPKKSKTYGNLYFVGGSVNPGAGMPMAVLSGQQVRDKIIKETGPIKTKKNR